KIMYGVFHLHLNPSAEAAVRAVGGIWKGRIVYHAYCGAYHAQVLLLDDEAVLSGHKLYPGLNILVPVGINWELCARPCCRIVLVYDARPSNARLVIAQQSLDAV